MLCAPDLDLKNSSLIFLSFKWDNISPSQSIPDSIPEKDPFLLPSLIFQNIFRMLCIAVWLAYACYQTVQSNWQCWTLWMTATTQSLRWRQGLFTCSSCAFEMRMTGGSLLPQGMTGSCLRPVEREEEEWLSADWLLGKPASLRGSKWVDR